MLLRPNKLSFLHLNLAIYTMLILTNEKVFINFVKTSNNQYRKHTIEKIDGHYFFQLENAKSSQYVYQ